MKALVLSAGGMFGAWQAGAWQAIAEAFCPDVIIGASIGSLNGWIIASGCPAEKLVELWRQPAVNFEPRWRFPLFPLRSLADPAPLEDAIQEIHRAYRPKIPYGVVVTQVPRLRPKLFTTATEVTWRHLMASCAVPFVLPSYRLPDQRTYLDGGFLGALPIWAAAEFGATDVVAVDVLAHLPVAYRSVVAVIRRLAGHRPKAPHDLRITTVQPPALLGEWEDAMIWKAANIERWIEEGREVAERALS